MTVAAIHGACLGGGCEVVLCCDYRLCSDSVKTQIGLPEVKLGLIPGFGGCLRLPRIIGVLESLNIILQGRGLRAKKALKIGLIDECVPESLLIQRSVDFANEKLEKGLLKRKKHYKPSGFRNWFLDSFLGRQIIFYQVKKQLFEKTKKLYPAPYKALEVISKTYKRLSFKKSVQQEVSSFCDIATKLISKNLIDLFFLIEGVKKQTGTRLLKKDITYRKFDNVGVLGAGVMGGGIGGLFALKGMHVRLKDINYNSLDIGLKNIYNILKTMMKRRRLSKKDFDKTWSLVTPSTGESGLNKLDIVIEAVVEDLEVKKSVIKNLANQCSLDCIVATNTSSFRVSELAKSHPRPENFLGVHFFNPVDKIPLVEIIPGEQTDERVVAETFNLAKKIGKTPVVVKDSPGFLVNRLLVPWLSEALYLFDESYCVESVDKAYTDLFGFPMGPFRLLDEVGWDIGAKVLHVLNESFGERMAVAPCLEKLMKKDRRGRKNKRGYYLYKNSMKDLKVDSSLYVEFQKGRLKHKFDKWEVIQRGVYRMINEASIALREDKIVEKACDVDLAMIMGTGFPPFRGGLLKYADVVGSRKILDTLKKFEQKWGARFSPSDSLKELAQSNGKFYTD